MNAKRVVLAAVGVFVTFFILEYLIQSVLLVNAYHLTAVIWRPEVDMKRLIWLMFVGQAIFSVFFAIIYAYGYNPKKSGTSQGLRYGLLMAFFLVPYMSLSWYVVLPVPVTLLTYWLVAGFIEMILLGLVAGSIYKQ